MFLSRSTRCIHLHALRPLSRPFSISIPRRQPRVASPLQQTQPQKPLPSFREEVGRERPEIPFREKVGQPGIRNQILFALAASGAAFTFAALQTNIETEHWKKRLNVSNFSFSSITNLDMQRAQNAEIVQSMRETLASLFGNLKESTGIIKGWLGLAMVSVMQPYVDASEGKRMCWKICMLNFGVYLAWKMPRFRAPMAIRFMHNPLSGLSYTMLTSVFSHRGFLHLLFNCLALEGFGSAASYYLFNKDTEKQGELLESTTTYHLGAFLVSAGLFSSLVSHVVSAKFRYPKVVASVLSAKNATKTTDTWAAAVAASTNAAKVAKPVSVPQILPSLGMSGAVYAAVTLSALAFPHAEISLYIPPSHPIPIQWGVGGLVCVDILGILRGWKVFDHWAHLGGALFGVVYWKYGSDFWMGLRKKLEPLTAPSQS